MVKHPGLLVVGNVVGDCGSQNAMLLSLGKVTKYRKLPDRYAVKERHLVKTFKVKMRYYEMYAH